MTSVEISCVCYSGLEGFNRLSPEWFDLAISKATHFLHFPGWYQAELERSDSAKKVFFVAIYASANLVAVLPLELVSQRVRSIEIPLLQLFYPNEMGVNDIFTTIDLNPKLQEITQFLRRELPFFVLIKWQCVSEDRGTALGMSVRLSHSSKYLDFSSGADEFWGGYSKKFVKGLLKKSRKAEQLGNLRLECVRDVKALKAAFSVFLGVEDSGWKGDKGTSIIKQPDKLAYYQTLLSEYSKAESCQINVLWLGGQPIAAQFGIVAGDALHLLKIGFDEQFSDVSPGYLILERLINYLASEGSVSRISFVTGVGWIDRWKPLGVNIGVFYSDNGSWWSKSIIRLIYSPLVQRFLARR